MTIEDKIRDEKLKDDINRESAKILALFLGKVNKYECCTGKVIPSSYQRRIIEASKFKYP